MNLFELAGIEIVTEEKSTKEKGKVKTKGNTGATVRYELPLSIYYCGTEHQIQREEYPEKEFLTEDELLHHLRENFGYRILTAARCSFEYLKDSNEVIVYLKNPSKGCKYPAGINLISFSDGGARFVKSDVYGHIVGPLESIGGESLFPYESPGVYLNKKIPLDIICGVFEKFREAYPYELLAQIFFDRENEEYILHFPEQKVSKEGIWREKGRFFLENKNQVLFAEIHSHGEYSGEFSPIDDMHEVDFLIYGVIGKVKSLHPEINFRIGFNGNFSTVDLESIFKI